MEMDPMDDDETPNDRLARRIAAAQERNRARSAVQGMIDDHPIALLAGGLLLGALVARLLPRNAMGKLGTRAAALTMAGAEMAALLSDRVASTAGEAAREGRGRLGDLGETFSETATEARRRTADLADIAITTAKAVGADALRRVSQAADRVRH